MSQTTVRSQLDGNIARLQFCNPKKHNALPQSGWLAVAPTIEELIKQGARAIIVAGENACFCAGADISEFDTFRKDAKTARAYEQSNIDAFTAIRNSAVPTIAQIEGYCLGGGFGLAAACDLRIASQDAKFAIPAAKLGMGYPVEAMADIVRSIGAQNTKQMLFTGRQFSAEEMLRYGFLLEAVEPSVIANIVEAMAQQIAELAPLTHRATKAAIEAAFGNDHKIASALSDATFTSVDYAEGRQAFLEKRKPKFKGT